MLAGVSKGWAWVLSRVIPQQEGANTEPNRDLLNRINSDHLRPSRVQISVPFGEPSSEAATQPGGQPEVPVSSSEHTRQEHSGPVTATAPIPDADELRRLRLARLENQQPRTTGR